jgi:hypothetical protein
VIITSSKKAIFTAEFSELNRMMLFGNVFAVVVEG